MVASARIQILTSKVEEMAVLAAFLTNPNLIKELEEEVKKLNALTDEEQARLHEAKILMQQRDALAQEIPMLQSRLADEREKHAQDITSRAQQHETWLAEENKKLDDEKALIAAKKLEQEAEDTRLKQYDNKLKETAAKMQGLVGQ